MMSCIMRYQSMPVEVLSNDGSFQVLSTNVKAVTMHDILPYFMTSI